MSKWIKISERLPLELDETAFYRSEMVIVSNGTDVGFAVYEAGNDFGNLWRGFSKQSDYDGDVTHWMPLPAPPEAE